METCRGHGGKGLQENNYCLKNLGTHASEPMLRVQDFCLSLTEPSLSELALTSFDFSESGRPALN